MRILLVTENCHPYSGSSVQLAMLASELRCEGHQSFIVYRLSPGDATSRHLRDNPPNPWVHVLPFNIIPALLGEFCSEHAIDIIQCHHEVTPYVVAGTIRARQPIVVNYGCRARLTAEERNAMAESSVRAMVSVSLGGAAYLRRTFPSKRDTITTIRQSTDIRSSDMEDRRVEELLSGNPFALLLATFRPYKGIGLFCQGVHRARRARPNLRGVVVGQYYPQQIHALGRRLRIPVSKGVSGHTLGSVSFFGPSPSPHSWIKAASVVVCASRNYEGIPGSLREAMLVGTPVVTTNVGYVRELVHDGWNGRAMLGSSPSALALLMVNACDRSRDIDLSCRRAQRYVGLFFRSITNRVRLHLDLYEHVLDHRPVPAWSAADERSGMVRPIPAITRGPGLVE